MEVLAESRMVKAIRSQLGHVAYWSMLSDASLRIGRAKSLLESVVIWRLLGVG